MASKRQKRKIEERKKERKKGKEEKEPNESNFIPWKTYLDYRGKRINFTKHLWFLWGGVSKRKFQEVSRMMIMGGFMLDQR